MNKLLIATLLVSTGARADFTIDMSSGAVANAATVVNETKWKNIVTYQLKTHTVNPFGISEKNFIQWKQINCTNKTHRSGGPNANPDWSDWEWIPDRTDISLTQSYEHLCNTDLKRAKPPKEVKRKKEAANFGKGVHRMWRWCDKTGKILVDE